MSIYKNNNTEEHHVVLGSEKKTACGLDTTSNFTKTKYSTLAEADKAGEKVCQRTACKNA